MNLPLTDARIIGRIGPYAIAAGVHEVQLRDGALLRFNVVHERGAPSTYLRAMCMDGGAFCVFDVRRLAPALAAELRTAAERDRPGTVAFVLRAIYPRSLDLLRVIDEVAERGAEPEPVLAAA